MSEIGTVEFLRDRIYDAPDGGDAVVRKGTTHKLIDAGDGPARFRVRARRIKYNVEDHGGGMFSMDGSFKAVGAPFEFETPRFDLAGLLSDDGATEGHPEQRLRITVTAEVSA
jgi:hypothetical protein